MGKAGLAKPWSPGDVLPFTEAIPSEVGVSKLETLNGWRTFVDSKRDSLV